MYLNRQYRKAEAVALQTMYEEVEQLWNQELKYRPGFETIQDKVVLPVLAAKICGVKNRDAEAYWKMIRKMCTQETLVVTHPGWFQKGDAFMGETPRMIANGRIDKRKVKESKLYPYGILRDEVQDYIDVYKRQDLDSVESVSTDTPQTDAPQTDAAQTDASSETEPQTTAPETEPETKQKETEPLKDGTIHEEGETFGTVYVADNRAFSVYYFNQTAADTYAQAISSCSAKMCIRDRFTTD